MTVRGPNGEQPRTPPLRIRPDMAESIETIVTYLEMRAKPQQHVPPPANLKLLLMRAEHPPVHFYRYLYDRVGNGFMWIDRKMMSDDELAREICAPDVEIYVLY